MLDVNLRQAGNAAARDGELSEHAPAIDRDLWAERCHLRPMLAVKAPGRSLCLSCHYKAMMVSEIGWLFWRAVDAEIDGTGVKPLSLRFGDPPRHQAGVRKGTDSKSKIEALFDQIDLSIGQIDDNVHLRVPLGKPGQGIAEDGLTKLDWRCQPEIAPRPKLKIRNQIVGSLQGGKCWRDRLEIALADIGKPDSARVAREKPGAKSFFKLGDSLAERRFRYPERSGGTAKALHLRYLGEGGHAVEILIDNCPHLGTVYLHFSHCPAHSGQ